MYHVCEKIVLSDIIIFKYIFELALQLFLIPIIDLSKLQF